MGNKDRDVRLVVSDKMTKKGGAEHGYLRVPRRARISFDSRTDRIILSVGDQSITLQIKLCYKQDLQGLRSEVSAKKLEEHEFRRTAFVTQRTMTALLGESSGASKHCYLTDGIEDLMLGADPEFALVDPSTLRFKYAQHIPGLTKSCELGHDGPLAEVRPPPATTVKGVIENITNIFKRDAKKVDPFLWLGGATYKYPKNDLPNERTPLIGGHIQFGNPKLLPMDQKNAIYKRVVRILDEAVGVPLTRIDTPFPQLRRNTAWNGYGNYGRAMSFEPKENRFEWRVPSGLWLVHPEIAQAVLGTSKAVVETCYQMMADNNFDVDWINARADRKGFLKEWGAMSSRKAAKIINDAEPDEATIELINRAQKKLRNMENYEKYKDEIETFFRIVKMSKKDRENINLDLRSGWLNKGSLIKNG